MSLKMGLNSMETERDLSNHRVAQAEQCLKDAKSLFDSGSNKGAANRAYYCVFHSMRSLLALERVDFKSHKGVMSYFREKYIKTDIFNTLLSKILTDLFQMRIESDYDDYYDIEREEAERQINNAELFYERIKEYLQNI